MAKQRLSWNLGEPDEVPVSGQHPINHHTQSIFHVAIMEYGSSAKPCSLSHSHRFPSGVIPVFSYAVKCRKPKSRSSSVPAPPFAQVLTTHSAPCRVLSSSKRSLSAPLSSFRYDFTQRAFSNREGYTWTPMYLQHCTKPYVGTEIINQDWDAKPARPTARDFKWPPVTTNRSRVYGIPHFISGHNAAVNRPISYSKFMESPYLNRGSRS